MVMTPQGRPIDELSQRRLVVFERRYGAGALDFACHAAFPLTITTDLSYCLRETFFPTAPWHWAADVLLSGLCNPAGYDLYDIEGSTRRVLLQRLLERFGESRLWKLDQFMKAYLQHRLQAKPAEQNRLWLLGDRPHWTALACLRPDEAFAVIQQELQQQVATGDPQDRFRFAALIESYADLLAQTNFRPILLDWADRVKAGEPIDETATVAAVARQAGFPLERLDFEVVTIVFEDASAELPEDGLRLFTFETVTVDRRGAVVKSTNHQAFYFVEPLGEDVALEMVAIPSGEFWMGSPKKESGRYDNESPRHRVTVPPFFISKYPITQAQWRLVAALPQVQVSLKADPADFKGADRPVERVSWHDAVEFCDRLSAHTGREYRLPTEAEWEYACRAGTTTPFHFGAVITPELANYDWSQSYHNSPTKKKEFRGTTPVGQFPPNAFGLYDMHGNVWEWCLDHWHGNYKGAPVDGSAWIDDGANAYATRVLRGGSWLSDPRLCRSACRLNDLPGNRNYYHGFRVVCVPPRTV